MRVGVDLGGTKIEAILLDEAGGTIARERVSTPRHDYDATVDAIGRLVESIERGHARGARLSVGIGTPGAISPATGLVKNANSTWLNGRPLKEDLERRLGRALRLANDANCFALSEARDGAAAGARVVFGIIAGTGCGGGIVVDGRAVSGRNAIAGEWGHDPIPWPSPAEWPGPPCWCGKTGCAELFLSGSGVARDHALVTGESLAAAEIVTRAEQGDAACDATIARWEDRFARALAAVVNLLDPDAIVVGGGLSNVARLYANVPRLLARHVFSDRIEVSLLPPKHGDSSGVRGAAFLWE